jgi:hypothetical protein
VIAWTSAWRCILISCADYTCSLSIAVNADQWPDDLRLSDIEHRFVCEVCGKRGADVKTALASLTLRSETFISSSTFLRSKRKFAF